MTLGAHETLRQKIGDSRVGRPPIQDTDYIGDLFSRLLETRLRMVMHTKVVAVITSSEVRKLGSLLEEASESCLFAQAESKSRPFAATAILEDVFIQHLIEAMSGGQQERKVEPGDRKITKMDEYLSQDFATTLVDCFEDAIASPPRTDGEAMRFAGFVRSVKAFVDLPANMDMLTYEVTLQFGQQKDTQRLIFMVPLNVLDILRASDDSNGGLKNTTFRSDRLWRKSMVASAREAELKLIGILAEIEMTIEDANELEPGSIIELPLMDGMMVDLKIDQPGNVAQSEPIAFGTLGSDAGHRAVRLLDDPDQRFRGYLDPIATETESAGEDIDVDADIPIAPEDAFSY